MRVAKERPNMKRIRLVGDPIEPVKPIPKDMPLDEKENKLQDESSLSPERMAEGSSIKTALLSQILAQRDGPHQFRDWGINE